MLAGLCKDSTGHRGRGKVKVKVLVTQSCLTLCVSMDCIPPCSTVHEILQARILEWVEAGEHGAKSYQLSLRCSGLLLPPMPGKIKSLAGPD